MSDISNQNNDDKRSEVRRIINGQIGLGKNHNAILSYMVDKGYDTLLIKEELEVLLRKNTGKTRKSGIILLIIGAIFCFVGFGTWGIQVSSYNYYWWGAFIIGIPCVVMGIYKLVKN